MGALCCSLGIESAVANSLCNKGNELDHSSVTGALNGVFHCGVWAYCAVLLRLSRQLFCSFTV